MTDWEDFTKAADESPDIGEIRSRLAGVSRELDKLQQSAERLRSDLEAEDLPADPAPVSRAQWKLERYQARKKIRMVEALYRPKSAGDPFRMARDVWREFRTPTDLPPPPDTTKSARSAKSADPIDAAVESGRYELALRLIDEADPERSSPAALSRRRSLHVKMGSLSDAVADLLDAQALEPDAELARQARFLESRLIETDPTWLPALPEPGPIAPADPGVVLHLVKESLPYFSRGYTVRSQNSFLAQKSIGLTPEVVTHLGFPRIQGIEDFPAEEMVDGIRYHRLDLGPNYPYRALPLDVLLDDHATAAWRVAQRMRPAYVQAGSGYRGYETALVGLAIALRLGVPFIYEIRSFFESTWTNDPKRSESGEYYERRYAQELRCLNEADHVITIAESMREDIIGRGVPADKVTVVPNGVDLARFEPRQRRADLVERLGIGTAATLGYVSNLGWREGHGDLIRAGALLRQGGRDVKVLIVGDGPEHETLVELATELGIGEHVIFTGSVHHEEVVDYYELIDLFVVPRVDERTARLVTPLKPLEAMALEIPIIASDLPALRELVEPGVRGDLFAPGDPSDLANVAGRLLDDEPRRADYAQEARRWVSTHRTWEENAQKYREVYEKIGWGS